jgi:hypothetical protein
MSTRYTGVAAVAIPDPRYSPPNPAHVIVVTVLVDVAGGVWHLYPDGDCIRVSKPPADTAAKPARRRAR